jgi:hypothetical protein
MEDHETRRKNHSRMDGPSEGLRDRPKNRLRHSPKRRSRKTSSTAVAAIRRGNFGAIRTSN